MPTLEQRVDRLEIIFARFMERTEETIAEIRAETAELRDASLRFVAEMAQMRRESEKKSTE